LDQIVALRARITAQPIAEQPIAPFLQSDFRFHNFIIHASGNQRLIGFLAALRSQISVFQIRDAGYPLRNEIALEGHEGVLLALFDGRTEQAAERMAAHVAASKAGVLADMFGERGEGLPGALDHLAAT